MRNRIFFALCLLLSIGMTACATKDEPIKIVAIQSLPGVPDGAIHIKEKIFRLRPPETAFDHAVFWYQIAALHQDSAANQRPSGIILKSCKIYQKDQNGNKTLLTNFEGDSTLGPELGGLFVRNPRWFKVDAHTPIVNQKVLSDGLAINASSTPDKIVHWWCDRFAYDKKYKYQVEMKVKIVGDVALQIGGDYWKGQSSPHTGWHAECKGTNNCEAFVSEWYGDSRGRYVTLTQEL